SLERRLAFLTTVLLAAIWALGGQGYFWPAWAWLGLGDPVLLVFTAGWALRGLATAGSSYSLVALHDRVLVAHGRRALRARIDMLTHTRRQAVAAQAAGLRRIERDLHDGGQARPVGLPLQLGRAELRVSDQPEVRRLIKDAQHEARQAIEELRDLARGIVPPLLADRGLVAAVESLGARYGLGTSVDATMHRALAPAVENAAYFVI